MFLVFVFYLCVLVERVVFDWFWMFALLVVLAVLIFRIVCLGFLTRFAYLVWFNLICRYFILFIFYWVLFWLCWLRIFIWVCSYLVVLFCATWFVDLVGLLVLGFDLVDVVFYAFGVCLCCFGLGFYFWIVMLFGSLCFDLLLIYFELFGWCFYLLLI